MELVSRAMEEPTATSFRLRMPLIVRHLQAFKTSLGEEAYAAAWERGKGLDLPTVIAEFLKEQS
jgi:hypothetical protein